MSTRDKFVARMQAQLEDWRAELSKLETRAGAVRTDLRNKYQQAIQDLREKHSAAEARLGELKHAGDEVIARAEAAAARPVREEHDGPGLVRDSEDPVKRYFADLDLDILCLYRVVRLRFHDLGSAPQKSSS